MKIILIFKQKEIVIMTIVLLVVIYCIHETIFNSLLYWKLQVAITIAENYGSMNAALEDLPRSLVEPCNFQKF